MYADTECHNLFIILMSVMWAHAQVLVYDMDRRRVILLNTKLLERFP